MTKSKLYLLVVLPLVMVLSACSAVASLGIPGFSSSSNRSSQNQTAFDPSKMPVEQKLGFGTLKLEGTPQAVTAKEASDLLPLWKAVKSLSASDTASPAEIEALYKQIEGAMTAEQVQTIQKMTWTQDDMGAVMSQYGVQFGGPSVSGTPQASSTRTARRSQNNGGFGGGPPPDGGGFPGGPGGFGGQGFSGTGTPQPGARRAGMGMNSLFIDPLIKLLQTRAGGQ